MTQYGEAMRSYAALGLVLLAVPALAFAAKEGDYKGKVVGDRSADVTFRVKGKFVKAFAIDSVSASCGALTSVTVFVPEARIRDNNFRRRYTPVKGIDQKIRLRGSFDGKKASGTIRGGPTCVFKEEWAARRRSAD